RRHTSFSRDWSSDVCSSDLAPKPFSTRSAPWPASAWAMPSPIPLVDPVTIATLPFNMAVVLCDASERSNLEGPVLAVDVMGDDRSEERRVGKGGRPGRGAGL